MTTYDFPQLYRSTVGFDRLFDLLDGASPRSEWPPYDIEKKSENEYRITMAVAGFMPEDIDLTQHGANLHVTGKKANEQGQRQMLHRGIAGRSFKQTFSLADHVKVATATIDNGLLTIDLVREVPEQLKPRRIDIASHSVGTSAQDNQPKQLNDPEPLRQVG